MDGLTEGRMVHFVLDEGPSAGQHRPAVVVKVWRIFQEGGIQSPPKNGVSNLQVFTDSANDGLPNVMWRSSVLFNANAEEGTWHWIEKA